MIKPLALVGLALVMALSSLAAGGEAGLAPAEKISEAETRMWTTDQLQAITRPVTLEYQFHKTGTFEPDLNFDDKAELVVEKLNADGSKNGTLRFFFGEHTPMENSTVNPLLGHYLYADVANMNRLTDPDGQARERWRYFHRAIKLALAQAATVKPITFGFDGRSWNGHEINFVPYAKDPKRKLFDKFADKRYTVVVSDDLPGYLYRIETLIPGNGPGQVLIHEILLLSGVKPRL